MTVWDPFTNNPYRLLGIPREQVPPKNPEQAVVLVIMGLTPEKMSQELFDFCMEELQSSRQAIYRATWFDSTRPLDQLAWLDICEGRPQDAWRRWSAENHLLSAHNLAVLAHLRWLKLPDELTIAKEAISRWRELADLTQDTGYQAVVSYVRQSLRQSVAEQYSLKQAGLLRDTWNLGVLLTSAAEVQAEQMEVLAEDLKRWELDLARLHQQLLQGISPDKVSQDFEANYLAQVQFLILCSADNLQLVGNLYQNLALFYHSLAQAWWDQATDPARDYAQSWQEKAIELVSSELKESWRADLEHWRVSRIPVAATPVEVTAVSEQEVPNSRRRLGLFIAVVVALALIWAWWHQASNPMARLTRPAAQKRVDQIVTELTPLAEKLSKMSEKIQKSSSDQRKELEVEQERLKQRHQALKEELVRLQHWLDTH